MALGAGREALNSKIDPSVGVVLHKKIGEDVKKGEPLCTAHYNQQARFRDIAQTLLKAFEVNSERVDPPPLIKRIVE